MSVNVPFLINFHLLAFTFSDNFYLKLMTSMNFCYDGCKFLSNSIISSVFINNSHLSFPIISMDPWVPIIFNICAIVDVEWSSSLLFGRDCCCFDPQVVPALASRRSFRLTPVSTLFCEHFLRFWLSHDIPGLSCTNLESAISPQGLPKAGDDIENPRSGQRCALWNCVFLLFSPGSKED